MAAGALSSNGSETSSEDGWVDADQDADEEAPTFVSLLDDHVFTDAMSMVTHCRDKFGFDFLATRDNLGLDFYGCIKLINYVRRRALDGAALPAEIQLADLEDDLYLKPVLEDDAFIMCLDELPDSTLAGAAGGDGSDAAPEPATTDSLRSRNAELQEKLDLLVRQFVDYRLAVQQTLDRRWGEDEGAPSVAPASAQCSTTTVTATPPSKAAGDDSKYYWESYASNEIHEIMLKDAVRTEAYRDFVYNNKDLFKGKVILDIGCGTGILSMFCAKAGARMVIAVDKSDIVDKARENVFHNGLSSQITCLKGRIEEVTLPVAQVDVIISEWMGYCLLFEAMLPSVIWARDRYLAPDGLLVPSHASLWIAPFADQDWVADHFTFWRDIYGFDMKAMQEGICTDSHIEVVQPRSACGDPCMFRMLDLHTVGTDDLVFEAPWQSSITVAADRLDGFLIWFDIFFCTSRAGSVEPVTATALSWTESRREDRIAFTTGPFGTPTHWKQGILPTRLAYPPLTITPGQVASGKIAFSIPADNPRGLVLDVSWRVVSEDGKAKDGVDKDREEGMFSQVWEVR